MAATRTTGVTVRAPLGLHGTTKGVTLAKLDKAAPSLADAMTKSRATAGRELRVDEILGMLGDADRDTLTAWLHDTTLPITRIEGALKTHTATTGVDVTASSGAVRTWRRTNGIA